MRKLTLKLQELEVDSFVTAQGQQHLGTVNAHVARAAGPQVEANYGSELTLCLPYCVSCLPECLTWETEATCLTFCLPDCVSCAPQCDTWVWA